MGTAPRRLVLDAAPGAAREVGVWLAALADYRRRTRRLVERRSTAVLDFTPPGVSNAIGTLCYHIAATEMNWLYEDIVGAADFPPDVAALLPHPYHAPERRLFPVTGVDAAAHVARLDATRAILERALGALDAAEFRRERALHDYVVTPEWICFHLLEHEAHHAGQIAQLVGLARAAGVA